MLSPQNIAIGCAACGLVGNGEILGKIAKYAFGFAIAMAALVFVGSLSWRKGAGEKRPR